jgi:hypothetical protein
MDSSATSFQQAGDADIFTVDIPDAALEKAAAAIPGAAMSFPNAPTVSIIVVCCSFNGS